MIFGVPSRRRLRAGLHKFHIEDKKNNLGIF